MNRLFVSIAVAAMTLFTVFSETPKELKVWKKAPKTDNGITAAETYNRGLYANVTDPTLTVYTADPKTNTGAAVLICPGGGYSYVAAQHEGHLFAQWLASKGIAGVVLKYRLPNKNHEVPLADAQKSMEIIRKHAKEWRIDKQKIGVAGFSAGGHLASTLSTHYKKKSKPAFSILVYPVISMRKGVTHNGSRVQLLGKEPSDKLVHLYSNAEQINRKTPPTLLIHCKDDTAVPIKNSEEYYAALEKYGVKRGFKVLEKGGHGFGMNPQPNVKGWQEEIIPFLRWAEIIR